jgi:GNAT superfamily N-acetyltransferase
MWWRIPRSQFSAQSGAGNRRALRRLVQDRVPTGLIGYAGRQPVGWIAVGPRETLPSLDRSRVLRRLDDEPVWSITCLFIAKEFRGQGVAGKLVGAAYDYVRKRGGRMVEAYPTDPRGRKLAPVSSYMGTPALFRKSGFRRVAKPSDAKLIMRREVTP